MALVRVGWVLLLLVASCSSSKAGTTGGTATTGAGTSSGGTSAATTSATGSTSSSSGSSSGCGLNAQLCGGACVVTVDDPNNCGSCSHACGASGVCLAGQCFDGGACPQGTTDCAGRCVDLLTSDANCGMCGQGCDAGTGCANGGCVPAVSLSGPGPSCPAGGPPIYVLDAGANGCTGNLAQITFRYGLCTCADAISNNLLYTDAFDSALGPYVDGGLGAAIGVDGQLTLNGGLEISGACWVAGGQTFSVNAGSLIGLDLHANGPALVNNALTVGNNAYVNGNVTTNAAFSVAQTLFVPTGATVGSQASATHTVRGPVTIPEPCDCSNLIDVAGVVAAGATTNDDALLGLDATVLAGSNTPVRLDLPCGRYYLTEVTPNAAMAIAVHGRTAVFVGGNVQPNAAFEITIDPGATLDLFVGGNLIVNDNTTFGSTLVPAQTRIYVAGSQVTLNNGVILAGNFYTPNATVIPNGQLDLYGSIFAGGYQGNASTFIHYDSAILQAGAECADAGMSGVPVSDAGCQTCADCQNQACNAGVCGACTTDGDCCSPLLCSNGVCQIVFQ